MQSRRRDDPEVWEQMRERLMGLTMKQLKQLARDEGITLGYAAARKDTMVGAIVAERRHRALQAKSEPGTHPWRRWNSVNNMPIPSGGFNDA